MKQEFWEGKGRKRHFSKKDEFGFADGADIIEWRCCICYHKRSSIRGETPCGTCGSTTLPILMSRAHAYEMQPFGDKIIHLKETDPLLPIEDAWRFLRSKTEPRVLYAHKFREDKKYAHRR